MKETYQALRAWLCACGLLCACTLHAQEKKDSITGKVHRIDNVTVTARRAPKRITASSPIQQLGKKEMERLGVLEVSDAVRHFSGVSLKDYGGIGGMKTVSVRSLGSQHTAVSYDGVAISDCQSGQVDISRFSLDNISELTLQIGQSDDIYQTARMYASAGSLHIQTEVPNFDKRRNRVSAHLKAGSFGLANPSVFYAQPLSERLSASGYFNFLRADGNYPFQLKNGQKVIDSKRNNSDVTSYRAECNLFAQLTLRQTLKTKLYLFDSERGLPGSVVYDNPYAAERLYDRNYFGQITYENLLSSTWKFKVNGKFNYSWNRDYDRQIAKTTDYRYRQTETYLSGVCWTTPFEGLSFSVAQDFAYNYLSTTLDQCQYPERFTWLTALAGHYRTPHLTVSASLLNTYITENVKIGQAADDRKRLSPALSLSWKPLEDYGWRIRASYKDIFRVPTFNDLYYLLIGNNRLKPESTRQFNLGTTWNQSFASVVDYLQLSVDAYYNRVNDKIVAIPTLFVWKMSNVGKVETLGLDVSLSSQLTLTENCRLHLTGTYNYMQAEDITNRESKVWRNQIAYTPKHSGSGSLTLELPWFNLTYNLLYASERYRLPYNSAENRIEPYTDSGLSLSHVFRWKEQSLRIQLDALNLGNKNYEVVRFYPMPGRNFKIALSYNL